MSSPPAVSGPAEFGVAVQFASDRVVVRVSGEVDLRTAPTVAAALGSLADGGPPHVVLDLNELTFMDAAGLGVIVHLASRLTATDGHLTVRSAPALTRQILDLTGVSDLVKLSGAETFPLGLGAEERSGDGSLAVDPGVGSLRADLARVGSMRADTEVIDASLRLVTALASATVGGADGVSVSLVRHGQMTTVAASDETIRRMDHHQYATGQGPCLAAAAEGHWFHVESLAAEDRWPAFVPLAIDEGIASVLSTPLMAADRPMGALNIYSHTDRAFGAAEQKLAALFATQASGILAGAGVDVTDEEMGVRIAVALSARELIAQAQGVYMARQGCSAIEAAAALHRSARAAETSVLAAASEVVGSAHQSVGSLPEA